MLNGINASNVEFYTAGDVLQDTPGTSDALTLSNGLSTFIASGTVTVSAPLDLTDPYGSTLYTSEGGTLAVTGNLTVSNGLYVGSTTYSNGTPNNGTVTLSGNHAITGLTRLDYGVVLQLAGTGANQPLGGTSSLQVTNEATLLYGASNQVPTGVPVTMFANGIINVNGQSQDLAHALGALTLSGNAELDFGPTLSLKSVLAFGNSSAIAWSGLLNVYDYRGTPGVGGGVDQLFFGTSASGLTAAQLADITFYAGGPGSAELGTGIILSDGEVTYTPSVVPEPSTWALLGVGTAGLGLTLRRRSIRK